MGPGGGEGSTFKQLVDDAGLLARATGSARPRAAVAASTGSELLLDLRERWSSRASTARVNEVLQMAQGAQPPPRTSRRCTTPRRSPPRRRASSSSAVAVPGSGLSRRYLENRFRAAFELEGIPLRMRFRSRSRRPDAAAGSGPPPAAATLPRTGRGAAWLARLTGGQKVAGSNPAGPTDERNDRDRAGILRRGDDPERPVVGADRPDPGVLLADRRRGDAAGIVLFALVVSTDWVDGHGTSHRTGERAGQDPRPVADRLAIAAGLLTFAIVGIFPSGPRC